MIRVICPRIRDIIQDLFSVQSQALCDGKQSNGTESTLGVDIETFTLPTSHIDRELTCYGKSMTDLGLSCPELAEELGYGAGLDTT